MKSNMVLASLFVVCASGSLMSMENNGKSRLNFLLNHAWEIKANSAQNMEYEVKPSDFLGKKITEAVALNEHDVDAVTKALNKAAENQETVKVAYALNNKAFLATITPIIKANQKNNFFVKVEDNEECVRFDD